MSAFVNEGDRLPPAAAVGVRDQEAGEKAGVHFNGEFFHYLLER